VKAGAVHVLYS